MSFVKGHYTFCLHRLFIMRFFCTISQYVDVKSFCSLWLIIKITLYWSKRDKKRVFNDSNVQNKEYKGENGTNVMVVGISFTKYFSFAFVCFIWSPGLYGKLSAPKGLVILGGDPTPKRAKRQKPFIRRDSNEKPLPVYNHCKYQIFKHSKIVENQQLSNYLSMNRCKWQWMVGQWHGRRWQRRSGLQWSVGRCRVRHNWWTRLALI